MLLVVFVSAYACGGVARCLGYLCQLNEILFCLNSSTVSRHTNGSDQTRSYFALRRRRRHHTHSLSLSSVWCGVSLHV